MPYAASLFALLSLPFPELHFLPLAPLSRFLFESKESVSLRFLLNLSCVSILAHCFLLNRYKQQQKEEEEEE